MTHERRILRISSGSVNDTETKRVIDQISNQLVLLQEENSRLKDRLDALKFPLDDYYLEVSKGNIPGSSSRTKFGRNALVGILQEPLSPGGIWQTPQVGGATALRVAAGGNVNDDAGGTGARVIEVHGLDVNGDQIIDTITTAGAAASAPTTEVFLRLNTCYVLEGGTYGASNAGTIVIENAAGGTVWTTILFDNFARGRALIGFYSVPAGHDMYIQRYSLHVDAAKPTQVLGVLRTGILDVAAPYSPIAVIAEIEGMQGQYAQSIVQPVKIPELSDFGFFAAAAVQTSDVSVGFEFTLVKR